MNMSNVLVWRGEWERECGIVRVSDTTYKELKKSLFPDMCEKLMRLQSELRPKMWVGKKITYLLPPTPPSASHMWFCNCWGIFPLHRIDLFACEAFHTACMGVKICFRSDHLKIPECENLHEKFRHCNIKVCVWYSKICAYKWKMNFVKTFSFPLFAPFISNFILLLPHNGGK